MMGPAKGVSRGETCCDLRYYWIEFLRPAAAPQGWNAVDMWGHRM